MNERELAEIVDFAKESEVDEAFVKKSDFDGERNTGIELTCERRPHNNPFK